MLGQKGKAHRNNKHRLNRLYTGHIQRQTRTEQRQEKNIIQGERQASLILARVAEDNGER